MNTSKKNKSEGEEIIKDYLEDRGIEFQREVPIYNLKNDTKSVRRADFYLPRFKVYVEFQGEWKNPKSNDEYHLKKAVYRENNIPCVYIFPDNLGPLNAIFLMRMTEVFEQHPELKYQKFLFNLWKFKKVLWIGVMSWFMLFILTVLIENLVDKTLSIGASSIIIPSILAIYFFYYAIKLIFFNKEE